MAKIHTPIPSLKLNDGTSMPMLGYGSGTKWLKSGDDSKEDDALVNITQKAIEMDYRYIDTAEYYKTEPEVGSAIKASGIDRSKLYVVAKLDSNPLEVETSLRSTLKKLQLDYVDQYLIHHAWWTTSEDDLQKQWALMEEVQAKGLTKSIGVSNYLPKDLNAILKTAKVKPAVNQIEFHYYLQRVELLDLHKQHGIATVAYGPLAANLHAKPGPADNFMASLAKKYAVSESEIAIRWCIDQDIVAVTTTSKEQRLSDVLRCATFKLTPTEIKTLRELGEEKHFRKFWTKHFKADDRT